MKTGNAEGRTDDFPLGSLGLRFAITQEVNSAGIWKDSSEATCGREVSLIVKDKERLKNYSRIKEAEMQDPVE
ncbi:hypothetical protein CapIbe_011497 [Capra ibex]